MIFFKSSRRAFKGVSGQIEMLAEGPIITSLFPAGRIVVDVVTDIGQRL